MDPEIKELRDLVQKNLELTAENNRMIHAMRRNARMANVFRILYWLIIIAILGASYYFYIAPYISKFEQVYTTLSGGGSSQSTDPAMQAFFQNAIHSFQKYLPHVSTSTLQ